MANKKKDFDMDDVAEEVEKINDAGEHLANLSAPAKQKLFAVKQLYKRYTTYERQYRDELEALERKYLAIYQPLFDRRAAIVTGEAEPAAEELQGYVADASAPAAAAGERGIPKFWYHAMFNNQTIRDISGMSDRDEEVLASLMDIRYTLLPRTHETVSVPSEEDPSAPATQKEVVKQGFQLTFTFAPNEFFSERTLTKTYYLTEDENGEPMFDRAEATKPTWLPGKNVTVRTMKKTLRRGGKGGKRGGGNIQVQTVEEPCASFFQFFIPPQLPASGEEMDPDEFDELSSAVQEDFEVGCEIRDTLCPKALLWYTGEATDENGDEEGFDEDDEEDGDEDEDEEEEDDDDEDK